MNQHVNRRSLVAAAATVASIAPAFATEEMTEDPHATVLRLMEELSEALGKADIYHGFMAEVHPPSDERKPWALVCIDARDDYYRDARAALAFVKEQDGVSLEMAELIKEHKAAWDAIGRCSKLDAIESSEAQDREFNRAYARFDGLMRKLIRQPCRTQADRRTKALYLARHPDLEEWMHTYPKTQTALLRSFIGKA